MSHKYGFEQPLSLTQTWTTQEFLGLIPQEDSWSVHPVAAALRTSSFLLWPGEARSIEFFLLEFPSKKTFLAWNSWISFLSLSCMIFSFLLPFFPLSLFPSFLPSLPSFSHFRGLLKNEMEIHTWNHQPLAKPVPDTPNSYCTQNMISSELLWPRDNIVRLENAQ